MKRRWPGWWVGLVFAACVASLRAATPAAVPPPPAGAATAAELQSDLGRFVAEPRFNGAEWGVKIVALDSGHVLFEHNPGLRLSPASNAKLYTVAMALDQLGGDFRISTPLFGTTAVAGDGELRGDLIIAGRGDPSWNPRREHKEFWTAFAPFVAALQQAGVKRIAGDVVADTTYLRSTPQGAGWTADDLNDYYGAEISAVSLEENYVDIRVTPGAGVGQPGTIAFEQPLSGLALVNRMTTG